MINLTIDEDSKDGSFSGPGTIRLGHSQHVFQLEVSALWDSIKDGRFERTAKRLLEDFCAQRGFDSRHLLS